VVDADGQRTGAVFVRKAAGLWGTIEAAVGMDAALARFTGLAVIDQNETPGLGARIVEPWFWGQFKGKGAGLSLVPEGTKSPDADKMDAITGATITTKAICDMLNTLAVEAKGLVEG